MASDPAKSWYRDGLQFSCTRCGHCCSGFPGYVWVVRDEIEALARHLRLTAAEFGKRYLRRIGPRYSLIEKPTGECVFYDRGCTVYPVRPLQCRSFPFWGDSLKSRRAWAEAARECPGMGKGRLYSTAEIVRIRRGEADATAG